MEKIRAMVEEKWQLLLKVLIGIVIMLFLVVVIGVFQTESKQEPAESELLEELMAENLGEKNGTENKKEVFAHAQTQKVEPLEKQTVIIDVKGAVHFPGVYQMEENSRVIDVVNQAGGFLNDAEQNSVNLAQIVADQMVIYIPRKGEDLSELPIVKQSGVNSANNQDSAASDKVDLNKATKEQLKTLHGIGDSKAESILAYREENGPFQTIEEITNVSGIGDATFEKIQEHIQVAP